MGIQIFWDVKAVWTGKYSYLYVVEEYHATFLGQHAFVLLSHAKKVVHC